MKGDMTTFLLDLLVCVYLHVCVFARFCVGVLIKYTFNFSSCLVCVHLCVCVVFRMHAQCLYGMFFIGMNPSLVIENVSSSKQTKNLYFLLNSVIFVHLDMHYVQGLHLTRPQLCLLMAKNKLQTTPSI